VKIGKKIGSKVYLHRSALELRPDLAALVKRAERLVGDWTWHVVRVNRTEQEVAFVQSPDFDTAPEPTVGAMRIVYLTSCRVRLFKQGGLIYHHKHLFVAPGYTGFDLEASRARSTRWERLGVDKSKIGRRDYWQREVLPLLEGEATCH
jgi:hypothetical protein